MTGRHGAGAPVGDAAREATASPYVGRRRLAEQRPQVPAKSRPQAVGDRWRAEVVRYLRDTYWPHADRADPMNRREYYKDRPDQGDISGVPAWTMECKNTADDRKLTDFMLQALAAQETTGTDYVCVVKKWRGKPVEHGLVVMTLGQWAALARRLERDSP